MQAKTPSAEAALAEPLPAQPLAAQRRTKPQSLAAEYANVLYHPVPPAYYDDDGYLCEDSKVSESTTHDWAIAQGRMRVEALLLESPQALIACELALHFEQDNRKATLVPDMTVALDAGPHHRDSYKFWEEESGAPDLVLEALSTKTWRKDVERKPGLYGKLGVREYWIVDPLGRLTEPIRGWHRCRGVFQRIEPADSGGLPSEVLDAELYFDGKELRVWNRRTERFVMDPSEIERVRDQRDQERASRELAERRADQAEQRIADLEALLRKRGG
jgi:Uma2 family endonuclease